MKELFTMGFWNSVKKTFQEAQKNPPKAPKAPAAPDRINPTPPSE